MLLSWSLLIYIIRYILSPLLYMHIYIYVCIYRYMCRCAYECLCMHTHTYICTYICNFSPLIFYILITVFLLPSLFPQHLPLLPYQSSSSHLLICVVLFVNSNNWYWDINDQWLLIPGILLLLLFSFVSVLSHSFRVAHLNSSPMFLWIMLTSLAWRFSSVTFYRVEFVDKYCLIWFF